ncbi:MAG: NAD(P)-binding protein [Cyanobacteriota bacterium]|nr:NAD(P)-binding protein [Cyanobacteriota bacterium]
MPERASSGILERTPGNSTALISPAPGPSLAVIGAGVAGCSLVARLSQLGWSGPISLWETGRGPGGRASTRRSRQDPQLRIDHGAPLFNLDPADAAPPLLLEPLLAMGSVEPWEGVIAGLNAEGQLLPAPREALLEGRLYRGKGGMDRLCEGLLALAGERVTCRFGQLVRHLEVSAGGAWSLLDRERQPLGQADWLVLSSSLLAHPRSRLTLGWDSIPLAEAARPLADPDLEHALVAIASTRPEARSNLLLIAEGDTARLWLQQPFRLLILDAAARLRWGLERVAIQPLEDGRCAVVAHSTPIFAEEHLQVYGSGSAIARQLGQPAPSDQEQAVITALTAALHQAMGSRIPYTALARSQRQLMRWGAAFPRGPGLPSALSLCPASRIGFCGDYLAGPGFGRLEGAWRSGEQLALRLLAAAAAG